MLRCAQPSDRLAGNRYDIKPYSVFCSSSKKCGHSVLLIAIICFGGLSLCLTKDRLPVILLPGLAGSVLEARLHRKSSDVPHWYCRTQADWGYEWLQLHKMVFNDCLQDELTVLYHPDAQRKYSNNTGVEVRPYDFGGLEGLRVLDPLLPLISNNMGTLIAKFEGAGFEAGETLFGAPYDFRLAGDGLQECGWYGNLMRLVEKAAGRNGGRRVVLVCHSQGCLVAHHFLRLGVPTAWRERYIARVIALNAPWEGSVVALKGSVSGDNFGLPFPHGQFHPVQATSPSGPWLFPTYAGSGDKPLIGTLHTNYSAADLPQLLDELQLDQQSALYPLLSNLSRNLIPLPTRFYCMFGYGVPTPLSYKYHVERFSGKGVPPEPDVMEEGDGDGTVAYKSLAACGRYSSEAVLLPLPQADHIGIVHSSLYTSMVVTLAGFEDAPSEGTAVAAEEAAALQLLQDVLLARNTQQTV